MAYIFQVPSLQQMAEVKIASELFNQKDDDKEIAMNNCPSIYRLALGEVNQLSVLKEKIQNNIILENTIKEIMMKRVSVLPATKPVKESLGKLITGIPFGLAINKWWFHHSDIASTLPKQFCWTQQGAVDNKKTAELMVKDENEGIEIRYKMACMYCFVNEIPILWKRIPETSKVLFYSISKRSASCPYRDWEPWDSRIYCKNLVCFWTHAVNEKVTELRQQIQKIFNASIGLIDSSTVYQFGFILAVFGLNRSAAEVFFEKLSGEEKDVFDLVGYCKLLLRTKRIRGFNLEIVLFLLNQMNEEQQREVFKMHAFDVLEEMLCWPYQTLFLETAKRWFPSLLEDGCQYFNLFVQLCDKTIREKTDYDYKGLFRGFWQLGCTNYDDFIQDGQILFKIIKLCEAKEGELVKDILKQATEVQKGQLLYFKELPFRHLPLVIRGEKWDCLKFLMDECITSKEILIDFKEYVVFKHSTEEDEHFKVRLTKALQLVNDRLHSSMEV